MSKRINFRPVDKSISIEGLIDSVQTIYDYANYEKDNNEIGTLIKSGNESFYEIGTYVMREIFKKVPESREQIVGYFLNNQPQHAQVYAPNDIKVYVDSYKSEIPDYYFESVNQLMELYDFAIDNNLEIWIH